jgi:hypothetical protein
MMSLIGVAAILLLVSGFSLWLILSPSGLIARANSPHRLDQWAQAQGYWIIRRKQFEHHGGPWEPSLHVSQSSGSLRKTSRGRDAWPGYGSGEYSLIGSRIRLKYSGMVSGRSRDGTPIRPSA